MLSRSLAFIFVLSVTSPGLSANPDDVKPAAKTVNTSTDHRAQTIAEAWTRMSNISGHGCGNDLVHDYGSGGGMRNFFCRSLTVFSWHRFLSLAPVSPFVSGPHMKGQLNLQSEKSFGHYNPEFVRWATNALVPAEKDGALRAATQSIYDSQAKTLARVHFKVWQAINHDPNWRKKEAAAYEKAIAKNYDAHMFHLDHYHDTLGDSAGNWGGHNPNTVRSATMWWLRRTVDGTAELWAEGLVRLLTAYDAAWLETMKANPAGPALEREPGPTPEYRTPNPGHTH